VELTSFIVGPSKGLSMACLAETQSGRKPSRWGGATISALLPVGRCQVLIVAALFIRW
jgi:hypothetical protein